LGLRIGFEVGFGVSLKFVAVGIGFEAELILLL